MPLVRMFDRLGLSGTEQRVVWLLLGHALDPDVRRTLRDVNTEHVADPTVDSVRRVVYSNDRAASVVELGVKGKLRRLGIIERSDSEDRCPEHRQTIAAAPWVVSVACGLDSLDPVVEELLLERSDVTPLSKLVVPAACVRSVEAASAAAELCVVVGREGIGRRSLVVAIARGRGLDTLQVDCRRVSTDLVIAAQQLTAVARDCRVHNRLPVLCNLEALEAGKETADRLGIVDEAFVGSAMATATRCPPRHWARLPRIVTMESPASADVARLWSAALPELSAGDAKIMAGLYPLAPSLIHSSAVAIHRCMDGQKLAASHVETGVRAVVDDRLAGLATRVATTQTWNDIVLPDEQGVSLYEFVARIRQRQTVYESWGFAKKVGRGLGVIALLSGPPGTGKTMAAGLIAAELGVSLYRVDMSKITSKWVGETERNLAQLFDAAEAAHALLLFDECDALFGKRSDVKSSNDRHANQETNYLLQRMETFTGVCILTTNHEQAIDEAFRRRLSMHVRFPMPEVAERAHLWRALLPTEAPVSGDLEIEELATAFAMSGGYIRNAVLRAAFLAADSTGMIDATVLARAAQLEYESMGKIAPRL